MNCSQEELEIEWSKIVWAAKRRQRAWVKNPSIISQKKRDFIEKNSHRISTTVPEIELPLIEPEPQKSPEKVARKRPHVDRSEEYWVCKKMS